MTESLLKDYIKTALNVRKNAYAKYSGFKVGAVAVSYYDETVIGTGCNVENVSYGLTVCAERNAIFNLVANSGDEKPCISTIILCGGSGDQPDKGVVPCGACLQVMAEFKPPVGEMEIVLVESENEYEVRKLSDFLPNTFTF